MIYERIAKLLNCYIAKSKKSNSTIQQYNNRKPQGGFTLVELMVVLSVTAVLGTLGIAGFVTYNQIQAVQSASNDLVTVLNIAKSRAQSQIKPKSPPSTCRSPRVLKGYRVTVVTTGADINKYQVDAICSTSSNVSVCIGNPQNVIALKSLPPKIKFVSNPSSSTNPKVYCFPTLIGGVRKEDGLPLSVGGGKITLEESSGRRKTIVIDSAGGIRIQ